jgi:hypothetical protein
MRKTTSHLGSVTAMTHVDSAPSMAWRTPAFDSPQSPAAISVKVPSTSRFAQASNFIGSTSVACGCWPASERRMASLVSPALVRANPCRDPRLPKSATSYTAGGEAVVGDESVLAHPDRNKEQTQTRVSLPILTSGPWELSDDASADRQPTRWRCVLDAVRAKNRSRNPGPRSRGNIDRI